MAIVINVPRDERYGDLGQGAGDLLGSLIERNRDDKDKDTISKVASGELSVSEGLSKVGKRNRNAVQQAGSSFARDNPASTFFNLDESGKVVDTKTSRSKPTGYVSKDQAVFNRERKPTDSASAINEILNTQIKDNPAFSTSSNVEKRRVARNLYNAQKVLDKETGKNAQLDPIGKLTEDNQIRDTLLSPIYRDYLLGTNGKSRLLSAPDALARAKRDVEKQLKLYNASGLTIEEFLSPIKQERDLSNADGGTQKPAGTLVSDDPLNGVKTLFNSLFDKGSDTEANASINNNNQEQTPITTDSDVTIVEPEVRVQDSTQAAVDVNYPVQDGEQWVDVGEGLPLVPQSMMDVVKVGNVAAVAPAYSSMANIPLHVAIAILQQNANKAPMATLLDTKVIPDPISDPAPTLERQPTAEELNKAAGGSRAPISINRSNAPPNSATPQNTFNIAPPGNSPFPDNKQIVK